MYAFSKNIYNILVDRIAIVEYNKSTKKHTNFKEVILC